MLGLLDKGSILENFIAVSPELVAAFRFFWQALVRANTWQERIAYPFRHLAWPVRAGGNWSGTAIAFYRRPSVT